MANWKKIVSSVDNKLLDGWETIEEVATQLECRIDAVPSILKRAIQQGEVEQKTFTFWNNRTKEMETVVGYRQKPRASVVESAPVTASPAYPGAGRPSTRTTLIPKNGMVVRNRESGQVGVLDNRTGRWRITWGGKSRPTFPGPRSFRYRLELLEE